MNEATGIGDSQLLYTIGKSDYTEYKTVDSGLLMPKDKSIDAVLEQRGERYGKFINNATVAQALKEAMMVDTNYHSLSADKREALDQIASKISRIVTSTCSEYKDSWTDIQGYSKLVADTLED